MNITMSQPINISGKLNLSSGTSVNDAVRYETPQELTLEQQSIARRNIGIFDKANIEFSRIGDYLCSAKYNEIDYDFANKYFNEKRNSFYYGACSSIRIGNKYGRNFDWVYDESVTVVVKTPHTENRFSSIGVTGGLDKFSKELVDSGEDSELYKLLPFAIVDGMNEGGLTVNTNVVPLDGEATTETIPLIRKEKTISSVMIPRYILDNFTDAYTAVSYIRDYVSVYMPESLQDMHYETHYMVADKSATYCLEFVMNEANIIDITDRPFMTNFYLTGVTLNDDGSVYTPATQDSEHNAMDTNGITSNGCGLERYNYLLYEYNTKTGDDIYDIMKGIKYTNSYYPENELYTEFVGINGLTVKSPKASFAETMANAHEIYENRSRDPQSETFGTWQTTHCCVYDMVDLTLSIDVQEGGEQIDFQLDMSHIHSKENAYLYAEYLDGSTGEVVIRNNNGEEMNCVDILNIINSGINVFLDLSINQSDELRFQLSKFGDNFAKFNAYDIENDNINMYFITSTSDEEYAVVDFRTI